VAALGIFAAACGHDAPVAVPPKPIARVPDPDLLSIVPRPRELTRCAGAFVVNPSTRIGYEGDARATADRLAHWLGIGHVVRGRDAEIVLSLEGSDTRDPAQDVATTTDEAYVLDVDTKHAVVRSRGRAGLFYGAETLAKLAGSRPILAAASPKLPFGVPCVHVDDSPRFAFRGMHLDVVRHFFDATTVMRYVDLLAFYKLNVFHFHLTDDQGFRLTLPSHPELATPPAYSEADVRAIVDYARERFVTVIPEIEMPGHARAILASHPELSCAGKPLPLPSTWGIFEDVLCPGNPATLSLVDDVLGDVTTLFPSRIVHIGGDEVPTTRWSACPKCSARMKAENLTAQELEGAFLRDVAGKLARRGRRTAVWDDALESGLPDDAIVLAWRNEDRGAAAAEAGHDVVMTPQQWVYFDRRQSRSSSEPGPYSVVGWDRLYFFDPSSKVKSARLKGAEGALWTEYVTTPADLETRLLPRLAALGEILWSPSAERFDAIHGFTTRFTAERPMLDAAQVRYFVDPPQIAPKKVFLTRYELDLRASWLFYDGVVRYTTDGSDPTPASPRVTGSIMLYDTADVSARLFLPNGRTSDVARGRFEKQALSPPRDLAVHEYVEYKYYEGDFHALPDFSTLVPKRAGKMDGFGFDPSFRANGFAVLYDSVYDAPEDGIYTCLASADDGVRVTIDDRLVVDDDGEHAPRDVSGEVALAAGKHALHVAYFQSGGGKALGVRCGILKP
jgi:hexosaminidase